MSALLTMVDKRMSIVRSVVTTTNLKVHTRSSTHTERDNLHTVTYD